MDYVFFDALIDAVFVINDQKVIVYCNESAAKLCDSSVRRLVRGKAIFDVIEFSDPDLFTMPDGQRGRETPTPYTELKFNLKSGKDGKVQIAIQPFFESSGEKRWVVMIRDVTLEEVLHAKYHKQLQEKEVYIHQLQEAQQQLEKYSKNLEQMVEERTLEVKRANLMLNAIMNSLGQGFFVFDKDGVCSKFYTRACEDILEGIPAHRQVEDVLKVPKDEFETFQMWLKAIYSEQLPFETLKELGPANFQHSQNRHVTLDYFPLRGDDQKISNIVVVATDKTTEYLANLALEKEKKYAKMVVKLVTSKKQFSQFLSNVQNIIEEVRQSLLSRTDQIDHEFVFRALHTLEGEAATYSATEIWAACREAQECIEPLKKGLKVDLEILRSDVLAGLANLRNTHQQFLRDNAELFSLIGIDRSDKMEISVNDVETVLEKLEKRGVSSVIRAEVADSLLREPVESAFHHFQDVVSIVAAKLNKRIHPIQFHGLETRLYLSAYQDLFSTFLHAYRNAVDHGIELPEIREAAGKSPEGTIQTHIEIFEQAGRWVRFKIMDDGGGISASQIRESLLRSGSTDAAGLTDEQVIQYVFNSGVTTKDEVGEFSGRGIGMNAIKAEAERLGGRAWVETELGRGTRLIVEVPDLPRVAHKVKAA